MLPLQYHILPKSEPQLWPGKSAHLASPSLKAAVNMRLKKKPAKPEKFKQTLNCLRFSHSIYFEIWGRKTLDVWISLNTMSVFAWSWNVKLSCRERRFFFTFCVFCCGSFGFGPLQMVWTLLKIPFKESTKNTNTNKLKKNGRMPSSDWSHREEKGFCVSAAGTSK